MKRVDLIIMTLIILSVAGCAMQKTWLTPGKIQLIEVARSERRWTGLAVSQEGRIFVNFPLWSASQPFAVGELQQDGTVLPYPNEVLNSWQPDKSPRNHFVCVQAMFVDARNRLWILDPANPRFEGVVQDGPKLFVVDLSSDTVIRTYRFGPEIAKPDSYLNDLRVDLDTDTVYMTDSGNGALVILNLASGQGRRLLDNHSSTQAEDILLTIEGKPWLMGGNRPRVHADGIALSNDGNWLYYQALTGRTMYRIATADLRDRLLSADELVNRVEKVAESGASDGLFYGTDNNIYISALEHSAIRRVRPGSMVETVIQDKCISWPDSFALGPGDILYFTTARIHQRDKPSGPFTIFRLESN